MSSPLPYTAGDEVAAAPMLHRGSLTVRAVRFPDGSIRIEGHDLSGAEYEYFFTVEVPDLPSLRAALGAGEEEDLLETLAARGPEIVDRGERRWLAEHEVRAGFSSWREWPD